jgi:hypothetical protein
MLFRQDPSEPHSMNLPLPPGTHRDIQQSIETENLPLSSVVDGLLHRIWCVHRAARWRRVESVRDLARR